MEPCGTPDVTGNQSEKVPLKRPAVVYLTNSSQTVGGRCLKYHGGGV